MDRKRAIIAFDIAIAVFTALAWAMMLFGIGSPEGMLATRGITSLKYYTVLSNILSGFASGLQAKHLLQGRDLRFDRQLKYVATVSVGVTFLTVALFLGPLYGFLPMLRGANLFFHALLPVAAMLQFVLTADGRAIPFSQTFGATALTVVYGIVYYANILINGLGTGPDTNDWYAFTQWGMDKTPLVFAAMVLVTWAIALALRALNILLRGAGEGARP